MQAKTSASRLSEARALQLLGRWSSMARLAPPAQQHGELTHRAISLDGISRYVTVQDAYEQALHVRGLLETYHLLACCRGFDPEENPSFWRTHFASSGYAADYKIDRGLFTRFAVAVRTANTDPACLAAAISVVVSTVKNSRAMAIQREVQQSLAAFVDRPSSPKSVELSVALPGTYDFTLTSQRWIALKLTLQRLERMWNAEPSDGSRPKLRVAVDDGMFTPMWVPHVPVLDDFIEIASLSCVMWKELHLCLTGIDAVHLRLLMQKLVLVDTVRALSLNLVGCDLRCVAAVISALPRMRSLRSFALRTSDGMDNTLKHRAYVLSWLAYALTARKLEGLWLWLDIEVQSGFQQEFAAAVRGQNCLQRLYAKRLSTNHGDFLPPGASAMVVEGSLVTCVDDEESVPIRVPYAQRVDVIARCGATAAVVVAGVGLVTAPIDVLSEWDERTSPVPVVTRKPCGYLVDHLVSTTSYTADAIDEALRIFGKSLTSLTVRLHNCIGLNRAQLQRILKSSPLLKTLVVLGGNVVSFQPLLSAYKRRECFIETLIYEPKDDIHADRASRYCVRKLINVLLNPDYAVASVMRSLSIETVRLPQDTLQALARAVHSSNQLTFVRVRHDFGDQIVAKKLLSGLVDQPLGQNKRSKLALYAFLLAARSHRVLLHLPLPCLGIIAEYAATPVFRCISWRS